MKHFEEKDVGRWTCITSNIGSKNKLRTYLWFGIEHHGVGQTVTTTESTTTTWKNWCGNFTLIFQSRKRLYNHQCLSVLPSVIKTPKQFEIIILHHSSFILHHSSTFFIHPSFILHSSFIILHSSFLHFATFKLFSLFMKKREILKDE